LASLPWIVNAGSLAVTVADVAAIGYGFVGLDNTGWIIPVASLTMAVALGHQCRLLPMAWIIPRARLGMAAVAAITYGFVDTGGSVGVPAADVAASLTWIMAMALI